MDDIEEMIKECEAKKMPGEVIAFAVGTGRTIPKIGKRKQMQEAFDYIKTQEGFLGIHPVDLWHTLLIYDTLNHAKAARNDLKARGCPIGQVAPILIPKEYARR